MGEFSLPSNIKQIGSIGDGLRIYMEDYVCTYLFQYAESAGYDERIAFLVGRRMVIDGQRVLFINGAIQGKHAEEKDGLLRFTDKSSEHAEKMAVEFFEGMEIVGWSQSQPSYGCYLNQRYAAYHLREFTQDDQVMFVMDPLERVNAFYAPDPERKTMAEIKGYFIYYDKNTNMHEYMLKFKASENTAAPPSFFEIPETAAAPEEEAPFVSQPEDVIRRHQSERVRKRNVLEQKRTTNLLVSLSAVLFILCFIMGAGLIQNQDRISKMEDQIIQLSTAYRDLFSQTGGDGTASVFAARRDEENIPEAASVTENENRDDETLTGENETAAETVEPTASPAPTETAASANETASGNAELPPPPVPESYTIQPGDSLIAISIRFYGDNSMVDAILLLNGIDDADRIIAGKTIALPPK